jgi:hypothetical protein
MAARTTETTVTFRHPFTITFLDRPQPAGTYRLVTDEEEILSLSFLVFQRTASMLHIPAISISGSPTQVFHVNSAELASALEADGWAQPPIRKLTGVRLCIISAGSQDTVYCSAMASTSCTSFDFDGFVRKPAGVTCCGEIHLSAAMLKDVFVCRNAQLLTDEGRLLDLTFSEKALLSASDVAHVDVTGELPASLRSWRD